MSLMVDAVVMSDVPVVCRMLAGILDGARDVRVRWTGHPDDLGVGMSAGIPQVVILHMHDTKVAQRLADSLQECALPTILVDQDGAIRNVGLERLPTAPHVCLDGPMGQGNRAWRRFGNTLLDAVRRLAAEASAE